MSYCRFFFVNQFITKATILSIQSHTLSNHFQNSITHATDEISIERLEFQNLQRLYHSCCKSTYKLFRHCGFFGRVMVTDLVAWFFSLPHSIFYMVRLFTPTTKPKHAIFTIFLQPLFLYSLLLPNSLPPMTEFHAIV